MKKKLAYLLAAVSVTVLILYLLRYKQALIYKNKIPISSTEIVQINLRKIEHHLLVDAIKNPFKYISFKAKKKRRTSFNNTIVLPKNLFLFTNNSNLKGAWVSNVLEIKDSVKLKQYLLQEEFRSVINSNLKIFSKSRITIAFSGNNVLIAYKKQENTSVISEMQTVFTETTFYKKEMDLLKSISNSKSDITYTNLNADFLEADFINGLFEIKGIVKSNLFIADTYPENNKSSIGFIAAKINKEHSVFKKLLSKKNKLKFKQFSKLSFDSIVDKWNGRVVVNLKAIDTKIDTIVTYEYDDDFNKIEKKSVQELNIPNVAISLGSDTNLYEYLYNNKAVQIIDNDTIFTGIPLYKMFARRQGSSLNIFTQKQLKTRFIKEKGYKLNLYINKYLESPLEFSLIPINKDYFKLLKNTSAKLTINDELLIQMRSTESNRNFLAKFLKP